MDAQIASAIARVREEDWQSLWEAVDSLVEESFATWAGGNVVGTTIVDGHERPVWQMPYPVYVSSVEQLRERLWSLGLFVPFDWMSWEGTRRYRKNPEALASAPIGEVVRLLTAIQRSERFVDGSIEGALQSGLMQAALARLRRWHSERRLAIPSPEGE